MSEQALLNRIHGETEALKHATERKSRIAIVERVKTEPNGTTTIFFETYNRSLGPFATSVTATTPAGSFSGEVVSVSSRSAVIRWQSGAAAAEVAEYRKLLTLKYYEGDVVC